MPAESSASTRPEANGVDEYISDPNHPVPFVGYTTDTVPQRYMVDDQRFASYRPDVLVYETDPLTEDVTIAGPISPKLKIASSGTDSDFVVKLIDVYPDNYATLKTALTSASPMRLRCTWAATRKCCAASRSAPSSATWERPEPLTPGKQTELDFTMPDLFHTFAAAIASWCRCRARGSRSPTATRKRSRIFRTPNLKSSKRPRSNLPPEDASSGIEVLIIPRP